MDESDESAEIVEVLQAVECGIWVRPHKLDACLKRGFIKDSNGRLELTNGGRSFLERTGTIYRDLN